MNSAELDAAIAEANRIFSRRSPNGDPDKRRARSGGADAAAAWPPTSRRAERRFGQPHARLFPYLGRKVRTPGGPGTLLQVFRDRVTVVLDSELSRCAVYVPDEIEPATWELSE